MSVVMMTDKSKAGCENVEIVVNHPLHSCDCVRHVSKFVEGQGYVSCPHTQHPQFSRELGPDCNQFGCKFNDPLYMETTYVGKVLELREMNGYDDSDFYAKVWDDEQNKPIEVMYASTRGWTYPNGANVDATPEVQAKYAAYKQAQHDQYLAAAAAKEKLTVAVGKSVKVVKGRKVPVGTVGKVFWVGQCKFDRYKTNAGLLLESGERVFTNVENLVVS